MKSFNSIFNRILTDPNPGGGGAAECKMGRGSGTSSRCSVKMRGSGKSLSRFEHENAGLRNELDPFWAWKCKTPELLGRVWLALFGPAANPRRCRTLCFRAEPAVGGDERVEIKEILKMVVSGTAKSAKKCKMVMLRNGCFGNLWKLYAPERKFRAENGGLSCGTYPICMHMEVPPPPPTPKYSPSWTVDSTELSETQFSSLYVECNQFCVGYTQILTLQARRTMRVRGRGFHTGPYVELRRVPTA